MSLFRKNACAPVPPTGNYLCTWQASLLFITLISGCGQVQLEATRDANVTPAPTSFVDEFDTLDTMAWGCEYTCPTIKNSKATFSLKPGVTPDMEGSWSKVHYMPKRFTAGTFKVKFALGPRPTEPVWWGVALYDEGPSPDQSQYSEIYFGYRTDGSLKDTQLLLETARFGTSKAVTVDAGFDPYDGSFHTGELSYDAQHIELSLDGQLLQTIDDTSVIPTAAMSFVLGTRLVETPILATRFDDIIDSCEIDF
jgi:hypothetical protein